MPHSPHRGSPHRKRDKNGTPFRIQNNAGPKKRRSSLAGFILLQEEVEGHYGLRPLMKGRSAHNRFVAAIRDQPIPFSATPRSRRLAKVIGVAGDRRLCFQAVENIDLSGRSPGLVPYRRDLQNMTRALYEIPLPPSKTSAATNLCAQAETCLGAPGLDDDFYSRLAAWSKSDLLAVAMQSSIVFRNMKAQTIGRIVSITGDECAACIAWNPSMDHLTVGYDWGYVRMYEPETQRQVRTFKLKESNKEYIGDFGWRDANTLTVGFHSGRLQQFDARAPGSIKGFKSHKARVCGVEWSPDSRYLAVGGGNGVVVCYDSRTSKEPLFSFRANPPFSSSSIDGASSSVPAGGPYGSTSDSTSNDTNEPIDLKCSWRVRKHQSTVKAMAWCPWLPDTLATGGGTRDGTIRFWDVARGLPHKPVIETYSQVTSLQFSSSCREIVSTHGYAFAPARGNRTTQLLPAPRTHSILVHKFSTGEQTGKIFDVMHGRVTHSCLSPDGTRLVTCGSDDSIRIFRIFGKQEKKSQEGHELWDKNVIR